MCMNTLIINHRSSYKFLFPPLPSAESSILYCRGCRTCTIIHVYMIHQYTGYICTGETSVAVKYALQ